MAPSQRILDQIEASADYYPPTVYDLLSHYSSFESTYDDLSNNFIPISQTSKNPKLFVIGLIPPAANVTGRLLDRSATVAAELGGSGQAIDLTETTADKFATGANSPTSLSDNFWVRYVEMCQRLGADPHNLAAVLDAESGFRPGNSNTLGVKGGPAAAKGLNQITESIGIGSLGMTPEIWAEYDTYTGEEQLPWVEKYFRKQGIGGLTPGKIYRKNFGGYDQSNPDGSLYASKIYIDAYLASHPENSLSDFKSIPSQNAAVRDNPGLVDPPGKIGQTPTGAIFQSALDKNLEGRPAGGIKAQIDAALKQVGNKKPPPATVVPTPPSTSSDSNTAGWSGDGSKNAAQAKQEAAKNRNKDLNKSALGKRLQAAQQAEINATIFALEVMKNTPPLRLLVNPKSLKVSSEKIISDGNWTRNGPIIEHWGDQQDKLEFSGKIAAFMAVDGSPPTVEASGGPGITRVARSYSASYQNFLSLWMLYRNNANLYTVGLDATSASGSPWARLSMVGSIYIFYDGILYFGSFDTFSITEDDTAPYTLEYNIQFTVRATFLLDQPPKPEEGSYGPAAQKFFAGNPALKSTAQVQAQLLADSNEQARLKAEAQAGFDAINANFQERAKPFDVENGLAEPDPTIQQYIELLKKSQKNPPKGSTTIKKR